MAKKTCLNADVQRVCSQYLEHLNTPVSLGVYLRIKHGEWVDLAEKRIYPHDYLDATSSIDRFRRDYAAVNLLRKFEGLPIKNQNLVGKAKESFYAAERQCKLTNMRLSHLEMPVGIAHETLEFLHRVRVVCETILGPLPTQLRGRFGPGTVFEFTSKHGLEYRNPCGKLMSQIHCTPGSAAIVEHTVQTTWWRRALLLGRSSNTSLRFVPGNRFATAPKDAMTLRGICIEAGGNMFAQLGAGEHIRSRLLSVAGLNLQHGQALHDQMACSASLSGESATIDVRQASDTVARMAVKVSLAYADQWYSVLDALRSPKTRVDGKWVVLEKFSSMGNGFTFELETLIFYALCIAATGLKIGDPRVKVYGDDIIVPTEHANKVLKALNMFGFTPNEKKTFLSGPFRESCGGDYFMGERVTPLYLKTDPCQPSDWITIANGLYAQRYGRKSSLTARRFIGLALRIFGPRELGDVVIHEDDSRRWTSVWRHGIRWIRGYTPLPAKIPLEKYPPRVQLASALYGVASSGAVPRDAVSGYRYRWHAFS